MSRRNSNFDERFFTCIVSLFVQFIRNPGHFFSETFHKYILRYVCTSKSITVYVRRFTLEQRRVKDECMVMRTLVMNDDVPCVFIKDFF